MFFFFKLKYLLFQILLQQSTSCVLGCKLTAAMIEWGAEWLRRTYLLDKWLCTSYITDFTGREAWNLEPQILFTHTTRTYCTLHVTVYSVFQQQGKHLVGSLHIAQDCSVVIVILSNERFLVEELKNVSDSGCAVSRVLESHLIRWQEFSLYSVLLSLAIL